ncbi:ras family-domain-containing protein [Lipomyces chichibuensis]|uniref:ras family-domain-containing protein n=1 Tax=Lipomyces chichibuensis TaxID=1546026 RepID=UPI0033434BFB
MSTRKENAVFKMVVLGDGGVGKTALTIQLCLNHFVETYDPTIEDSYWKQIIVDHQSCIVEILDTAGQEEYTALRDQWIRDGEGFVFVYSITSRTSYNRILTCVQQVERIKGTSVPMILIGNKSDKVTEREVTSQEGAALAKQLGCDFFEVSAKNNINLERAFFEGIRCVRKYRHAAAEGNVPGPRSLSLTNNEGTSVASKKSAGGGMKKGKDKKRDACTIM